MDTQKIFGSQRIDSKPDGTEAAIALEPRGGGSGIKKVLYMIVVEAASSVNCRIGLSLSHGPDGRISTLHSTPIPSCDPGTPPVLLEGTADDSTSMIGQYRHPFLLIKDSATTNPMWAVVTVFETVKPF